jgi:hypothetical protein
MYPPVPQSLDRDKITFSPVMGTERRLKNEDLKGVHGASQGLCFKAVSWHVLISAFAFHLDQQEAVLAGQQTWEALLH